MRNENDFSTKYKRMCEYNILRNVIVIIDGDGGSIESSKRENKTVRALFVRLYSLQSIEINDNCFTANQFFEFSFPHLFARRIIVSQIG